MNMIRDPSGDGSHAIRFAGAALAARRSGALWWADQATLIVADLHCGKSERMARRGGALLPPFETRETLARLAAEVVATGARRLVLLGDSFDDDAAAAALSDADRAALDRLEAAVECVWIGGNHDHRQGAESVFIGGLGFRHIARPGGGPDVSGHYHPKIRLAGVSRPAFLLGARHLILPAFGAYTGGLRAESEVLRRLVGPGIALVTGPRVLAVPFT